MKTNCIGVRGTGIPPHDPASGLARNFAAQLFCNPILALAKLIALVFLHRLVSKASGVRFVVLVLAGLTTLHMAAVAGAVLFQCVRIGGRGDVCRSEGAVRFYGGICASDGCVSAVVARGYPPESEHPTEDQGCAFLCPPSRRTVSLSNSRLRFHNRQTLSEPGLTSNAVPLPPASPASQP